MKNWKRLLATLLALVLVSTMFTGLALAEDKPITKIEFEKSEIEVKCEDKPWGGFVSLNSGTDFTVTPDDTTENIDWVVDDEKTAYVYGNKYYVEIECFKPGTVTVTAKAKDKDNKYTGVVGTFKVKFVEIPVTKIILNKYSVNIPLNDEDDLDDYITPSFEPANATYKEIEWTCADAGFVVSKNGKYKAKKIGTYKVIGTVPDSKKTTVELEVKVEAEPLTKISFSPATFTISASDDDFDPRDYVSYEPNYYNIKKITWKSSDPQILKISKDGSATTVGTKSGTVTITVEALNYDGTTVTGTCTVTVEAVALSALSFVKPTIALSEYENGSVDLKQYLKTNPEDAEYQAGSLRWESSNEEVVKVTSNGSASKGIIEGTATVTVTYIDNPAINASIVVSTEKRKISDVKFNEKKINLYFVKKDGKAEDDRAAGYVSYSIEPSGASYKSINVETTNAKVAIPTLYDGGVSILPVGKGSCKITLYVNDGKNNYTAQLKVKVSEKTPAAKLNKKTLTLEVGKKFTLKATDSVTKDSLKGKWSSSDKSVAKVDKKGKVKAVGAGRAVITFTPKDKNMKPITCVVKVK